MKFVYDLKVNEIVELIENHYRISFRELKNYKQIDLIRQTVNSYKHRKGFKDFRKNEHITPGDKFELTREKAFLSIDSTRRFFIELWSKIGRSFF